MEDARDAAVNGAKHQCYACGRCYAIWVDPKNTPRPDNYITVYEAHEDACWAIVICAVCFDRGGFDMWTDENEWDDLAGLNPKVPFAKLPPLDHDDADCWNPAKYPTVDALLAVEVEVVPT